MNKTNILFIILILVIANCQSYPEFTEIKEEPETILPYNNKFLLNEPVSFKWEHNNRDGAAKTYELVLEGKTILEIEAEIDKNKPVFTMKEALPPKDTCEPYRWWVIAKNDFQYSVSEISNFYVPSKVTTELLKPDDNSVFECPCELPTFEWKELECYNSYKFEYSTDASFKNIEFSTTVEDTSYQLYLAPQYEDKYYWRICGVYDEIDGECSNPKTFRFKKKDLPNKGSWQFMKISDESNCFLGTGLKVDKRGYIHLIYQSSYNEVYSLNGCSKFLGYPGYMECTGGIDIIYMIYDRCNWKKAIAVEKNGFIRNNSNLAINDDNLPYISYLDLETETNHHFTLKMTYYNSKEWINEYIGNDICRSSIALNKYNKPAFSYYTYPENSGKYFLKYAYYINDKIYHNDVDKTAGAGWNSKLYIDKNNVSHIIYHLSKSDDLKLESGFFKHAFKEVYEWKINTIDDSLDRIGENNSLIIDKNNILHVSYIYEKTRGYYEDWIKGTLKYAYYINNTWYNEIVDEDDDFVGYTNCIALDNKGNPHIMYVSENKLDDYNVETWIKHAYKKDSKWYKDKLLQLNESIFHNIYIIYPSFDISFDIDNNNNMYFLYIDDMKTYLGYCLT